MKSPYLHIKDLVINYNSYEGSKQILNIEELVINKADSYGIIGESGTGKTVLALLLMGLLETPPGEIVSGQVLLEGEDILKMTQKQLQNNIRGNKIAMIFQDPMSTLNPVFTVGQQLIKVIRTNQKLDEKAAYKKALETIELVKLPDAERIMNKYPHELSGGQRQRIIIALALSCGARLLIADEPTRNLDVTIQAGILRLIKELKDGLDMTIIFIANNPGLISATCNKAAVLYKGEIIEKGTTNEVLRNPKHPYTATLLNAIPKNKKSQINLNEVFSSIEINNDEDYCIYYNNCIKKSEICQKRQDLLKLGETHYVKCCIYKEGV